MSLSLPWILVFAILFLIARHRGWGWVATGSLILFGVALGDYAFGQQAMHAAQNVLASVGQAVVNAFNSAARG